jgi:hypothetical protein
MSTLDVLLAAAGLVVTALVIFAMVLLTPAGAEDVHAQETDPMGSNLSQAEPPSLRGPHA